MQHSNNKSKISMHFKAKKIKNRIFKKKVIIKRGKTRRRRAVRNFNNKYNNPKSKAYRQPQHPYSHPVPTFTQPPGVPPYALQPPFVGPPPLPRPIFHPPPPPSHVPPPHIFMQQQARINGLENALGQLMQMMAVQNASDANGGIAIPNPTDQNISNGNNNTTMNGNVQQQQEQMDLGSDDDCKVQEPQQLTGTSSVTINFNFPLQQ